MQTRLLAFLAETERSIRAEKTEPRPGAAWEMSRSVNYGLGLARLTLASRDSSGALSALGAVLLQSSKLADGTLSLRANLSWQDAGAEVSHPIYAKPEVDWRAESVRLSSSWLAGPPAKAPAAVEDSALLAAG